MKKFLKNIDWAMLREQKQTLVQLTEYDFGEDETTTDHVDGVVHVLDALQDFAVESGHISENEVFGKKDYPFNEGDLYYVVDKVRKEAVESVWDDQSEEWHDDPDVEKVYCETISDVVVWAKKQKLESVKVYESMPPLEYEITFK